MASGDIISNVRTLTQFHDILRKVEMVLRELGLSFETKFLESKKNEIKGPEFVKLNPNGRIPAIIDHHNNDFVVWCVYQLPVFS